MKILISISFFWVFSSVASAATPEIALVQYNADAHFGEYDYNLQQLVHFAIQAVNHGAHIIVFPEGSIYGYASATSFWCRSGVSDARCVDVRQAAEPIPSGRTSVFWEGFARQYQVYILFNIPEVALDKYYNTTAVFGPTGYITKYRKRALFVADEFYAAPGDLGPVTFATPFGMFGLLICMDANFDELYIEYKKMGVDRLIIPMDWNQDPTGSDGNRPAHLFFQSAARRNQLDLFVSDVSPWDGTGAYYRNHKHRQRSGLSDIAIGKDGVTYHNVNSGN